jgi:ABC-2 type transport system permease protein
MKPASATVSAYPERVLPDSLTQVATVIKYELLNFFRSRRFFVLLIIALVISGILTFLVAYYGISTFASNSLGFYSFWWGNSVVFVITINGIFFGGDAISGEFQHRTGYFLVPNPLRRSSIYVGKYFGALLAAIMIILVYVGIAIGNGIYYFGTNIPYQYGESLLFSIVYLIATLGVTFFFSSLFKTSAMSILVTAILYLFAFNIIVAVISGLTQIEPWFIVTYGSGIIGYVLTDPYPMTQTIPGAGPGGRAAINYIVTIPEGLTIMLVYFIVTGALGLLLFERKEFT